MSTEAQERYINALITEYTSVENDKKFYNDFMEKMNTTSLDTLSTKEPSALIQGLIRIKVHLEMQCGKIMMVEKDEIMRGQTMGRLDECMHNCEVDFNECEYLKNNG